MQTPLHRAATLGHSAIVLCLIERKAQVNLKDKQGNTPLHLACENDQVGLTFLSLFFLLCFFKLVI